MVRASKLWRRWVPETLGRGEISFSELIIKADHVTKGINHCQQLVAMVEANPDFELVSRPSLALLVFRLRPAGRNLQDAELNLLNQRLHTRLNARYDVFLTQTMLISLEREIFCIRFAMGGINTTMEDVRATWKVVVEEGGEVVKDWEAVSSQ